MRLLALIGLILVLPATAMAQAPATPAMTLGAQTHFSQGWNLQWMERAQALGVRQLRDGLPWAAVEKKPGVYDFPINLTRHFEEARRRKIELLLTLVPANSLYDGGKTVFTPEARLAYANYLNAVLDRYGDVVGAIEIGNEINDERNMTGEAAKDRAGSYAAILKDVYATVKTKHPKVLLLGGSTNVIGTGFLANIFAKGGLANMDGVVVHPYRSSAEHVDWELANLKAAMRRAGGEKPIYATEFSDQYPTAEIAAPQLIKMVVLMGSQHVARAYWYALADQSFFKNMGLYDERMQRKPAGEAFVLAQQALLPLGDPVRVDPNDRLAYVYRYGPRTLVMWGAPRPLTISGTVRARDARGRDIPTPTALGADPVILEGDFTYRLGAGKVIADSFLQYGAAPWSYFARTADGKMNPLAVVDWEWTSYLGGRYWRPLRINAESLAPAGDGAKPIWAVERYTSAIRQKVRVIASWQPGKGDGIDVHILKNGQEIAGKLVIDVWRLDDLVVDLAAGDTLDFAVGPNQVVKGDSTGVKIQLISDGDR